MINIVGKVSHICARVRPLYCAAFDSSLAETRLITNLCLIKKCLKHSAFKQSSKQVYTFLYKHNQPICHTLQDRYIRRRNSLMTIPALFCLDNRNVYNVREKTRSFIINMNNADHMLKGNLVCDLSLLLHLGNGQQILLAHLKTQLNILTTEDRQIL